MRKFLFFIALIGVIGGGGYYLYLQNVKSKALLQQIVPADACVFYSSSGIVKDWNTYTSSLLGRKLESFNTIEKAMKEAERLREVLGDKDMALSFSLHKTGKDEFELIYYLHENDMAAAKELFNVLSKKNKWTEQQRKLDQTEITEYKEGSQRMLTVCKKGDWLVASKSAFLVEEVIKTKNQNVNWKPETGKWVVFPENFRDFARIYFSTLPSPGLEILGDQPIVFEVKYFEESVALNGIVAGGDEGEELPVHEVSRDLIPMDVAQVLINEDAEWLTLLDGSRLRIVTVASASENTVLMDTLFVDAMEFPVYRFEEGGKGEAGAYNMAIRYNDHLVAASTLEQLEKVCKALSSENVWGKSLRTNQFLDNCNGVVSHGLYVNFSLYGDVLRQELHEAYAKEYAQNSAKFDFMEYLSLEMTREADQSVYEGYISLSKMTETQIAQEAASGEKPERLLYEHSSVIITRPYLVKNHNTGARELLFQDANKELCLVSSNGNLLWKRALKGRLTDDVHQVDAYRNGKLQYLFHTEKTIHLVDRNGDDVQGFPKEFEQSVASLSLFDYEKNRNYRFVASLDNGDVVFLDVNGDVLEPWNPKNVQKKLVSDVKHFRESGKDFVVLATADGVLHGFNRRGDYYPGFPVDLNLSNPIGMYVIAGSKQGESRITVMSKNGEAKSANTHGEIVEKNNIRVDPGSTLELIQGNDNIIYAINAADEKRFLNAKGGDLFAMTKPDVITQLYNFSGRSDLVVTCDSTFSTVHTIGGERIATFPSSNRVSCIYSSAKEELTIYKVIENRVSDIILSY